MLILQAEPDDKIGSIIISETTKKDEAGASVVARIVAISPTAFKNQDWETNGGGVAPYVVGDTVLTKRYPAGAFVVGRDGRTYMMVKDVEIIGKQEPQAEAVALMASTITGPPAYHTECTSTGGVHQQELAGHISRSS